MNVYLIIIALLILYIGISSSCFKNISKFTPVTSGIPDITDTKQNEPLPLRNSPNVYNFDTRMKYNYLPPVNPNVTQSVIVDNIPASPELNFFPGNDNLLNYSGGETQLIQIPLQYNDPYEPEQLRSQEILITPYNRIKYGTKC